jgi:hypothetical protein
VVAHYVPAIFHCIVGSSVQKRCNLSPLVAEFRVKLQKSSILLGRPYSVVDLWIEMIPPSLTTLFAKTARHQIGEMSPITYSVTADEIDNLLVLRPRP